MEIFTLQIGHYSNFVGTHFWNIQEASNTSLDKEINHQILFRHDQVEDSSNSNYIPRLLLFDLKGSLGSMSSMGNINNSQSVTTDLWEGPVTSVQHTQYRKNAFLRGLDDASKQYAYEKQKQLGALAALTMRNIIGDPLQTKKNQLQLIVEKEKEITESMKKNQQTTGHNVNNLIVKLGEIQQQKKELEEDIQRMEIRLREMCGEKVDTNLKYNFNLDSSVKVWSDYLKVFLDQDTIFEYPQISHNDPTQPFNVFTYGHRLFKDADLRDEVETKLHKHFEACDHLQGFHVLSDIDSGFGGITEDVLTFVQEEYPKTPVCLFGFYGAPNDNMKATTSKRIINLTLSMSKLTELCSIYLPLSYKHWQPETHFPNLKWSKENLFQTSSIFASAIDTISRPYRSNSGTSMKDMTSLVSLTRDMNISNLETSLPIPLYYDQKIEMLLKNEVPIYSTNWMCPLTPNTTRVPHIPPYSSYVVMCGVPTSCFTPTYNYSTQSQLLRHYLSNYSCNYLQSFVFSAPLSIPISFPHYFASSVSKNGILDSTRNSLDMVQSVPVMTHLQTTKQQFYNIYLLGKACKEIDLGLFPEYELHKDDLLECINKIKSLEELYK